MQSDITVVYYGFGHEFWIANCNLVLFFRSETGILRGLCNAQRSRNRDARDPFASFLMDVVRYGLC